MLIDISPVLSERIAVWPGDTGYRRTVNCAIADGANIDLSDIHTTVHVGAHADAPNHYAADGVGIAARPLDLYFGRCQVIPVSVSRGSRITVSDVHASIDAPRVLFRTDSFPDPEQWNSDFVSLSAELVEHLAARGVRLVGIDTPSIDLFDDKVLESHQAVARNDLAVLEGIVLTGVDAGIYTLMAFPLKLEGADASPVRAVLER
ncbi:MAG: hypothetical protein GY898_33630 [Proteobacteria bacterium]|nr:hypothetical protein [Pseudomonadota bacterium]